MISDIILHYKIIEKLGEGGMGVVLSCGGYKTKTAGCHQVFTASYFCE